MKALTIRQPWAGAIAHGTKRVENRSWKLPAKQLGERILIHAGARPDKTAQVYGDHLDVYSAIIATAVVTDCHYSQDDIGVCCSYWSFPNTYHWTLNQVVALPDPVPCKGRLGFWTPDPDVLAAIAAQTEVTA